MKIKVLSYFFTAMLLIFFGCVEKYIDSESSLSKYANKFEIQSFDNFEILKVNNPWQKARNVEFIYCLAEDKMAVPDSLLDYPFIKVPVETAIVFSTTHIGYLKSLSEEFIISGASGANYIYDSLLNRKAQTGIIAEVGYPPAINYEVILERNPDVVFLYGIESSIGNISQRLESAGIQTILIADFLEQHPLGKAEWIKVFASLTKKKAIADSIFTRVEKNYLDLCDKVNSETISPPSVMLGLPWKDTWYMAGGESFTARLLHDAGARYLWSDNTSDEYIPLSVEAVMSKALNADFWLKPGSSRSLEEITGRDSRYAIFESFQKESVYNNDLQLNNSQSNNFWEEGVVQPDLILKDLIKIFHPELLNEHDFVYYRKLK